MGTEERPGMRLGMGWGLQGAEVPTHHGHCVGGQQLLGGHGSEVGNIGERVHEGDQRDGNEDGARQVSGDRD